MNLFKYGTAGVFAASAMLLACGGSSSDNNGGGAGAGASSSSAGANTSSGGNKGGGGGSATSDGGSSSSGRAGGQATGSGGTCDGATTDPTTCPAVVTCLQTKCKAQSDAFTSTTGACASYLQCSSDCKCDQTCASNCAPTTDCQALLQTYETCVASACLAEAFSCLGAGTGGASGAGTKTCADLSTCCGKLTDATEKSDCTTLVTSKQDFLCGLAASSFCN